MSESALILPMVYALVGLACARARWAAHQRQASTEARFWGVLTALILSLALTKLPLVPSAWGETARGWLRSRGWYEGRRAVQAGALTVLGLAGLAVALGLARRSARLRLPLAPVLGAAVLVGHSVVRASSYHHADAILGRAVAGVRLATVVQAVGLLLVVAGSVRATVVEKRS